MQRIIKSLDSALMVSKKDKISHPSYGVLEVVAIYKVSEDNYEAYCRLTNFNNTLKMFDLLEIAKLKYRQSVLRRVK